MNTGPAKDGAERPVRVGILGCSDIARRRFLPALLASHRADLVAVGSRARQAAAALLAGATVPILDYASLLTEERIELVYLSLPNHLHEEWAIRALEAGKHVICEKPLGLGLDAVERMLAVAERQERLLYENLMFLHHPQHAAAKALLASGAIGQWLAINCVFCFPLPAAGNYRLDPARGGGAFHDLARYPLATADFFLPGGWSQFRGDSHGRDGLNLALNGSARSSSGVQLRFHLAFGPPYQAYYELCGTTGEIRIERAFTPPPELENRILVTRHGAEQTLAVAPADQFRLMLDSVCGLIRHGGDFHRPQRRSLLLAQMAAAMKEGCNVR